MNAHKNISSREHAKHKRWVANDGPATKSWNPETPQEIHARVAKITFSSTTNKTGHSSVFSEGGESCLHEKNILASCEYVGMCPFNPEKKITYGPSMVYVWRSKIVLFCLSENRLFDLVLPPAQSRLSLPLIEILAWVVVTGTWESAISQQIVIFKVHQVVQTFEVKFILHREKPK